MEGRKKRKYSKYFNVVVLHTREEGEGGKKEGGGGGREKGELKTAVVSSP